MGKRNGRRFWRRRRFSITYAPGKRLFTWRLTSANRQGGQDMYVASFSSAGDLLLELQEVNKPAGLPKPPPDAVRLAADGDVYAAGEAQAGGEKNSWLPASTKKPGSYRENKRRAGGEPRTAIFSLWWWAGKAPVLWCRPRQNLKVRVKKRGKSWTWTGRWVFSERFHPPTSKGEIIIRFASPVLDSSFIRQYKPALACSFAR